MPGTPASGQHAAHAFSVSMPTRSGRISPSGGIVRGKFPSRKNARMVHHRGLLELDAIYLFETSPLIASYQEQPRTLNYPHGARLRRYTPAFELLLRSGEKILVEVMHADGLKEAPRRERLDHIESHLRRSGIGFSVLTDEVVRLEPRLSTLKGIYSLALQHKAFDPQTHRRPPSAAAAAVASRFRTSRLTQVLGARRSCALRRFAQLRCSCVVQSQSCTASRQAMRRILSKTSWMRWCSAMRCAKNCAALPRNRASAISSRAVGGSSAARRRGKRRAGGRHGG